MDFVVPAPPVSAVPVRGGGFFPVRRVYCVGRNYAEHAREMGGDGRDPPFFFAKPADAVVTGGAAFPYPPATADVHHEVELVVAIGVGGRDIAPAVALDHVYGYAAGLDMTRRDLQAAAKKTGRPWTMAKGFDHSAPIGAIAAAAAIGHPARARIALSVNGATRQDADIADMTWAVPDIVAHLSALVRLEPGDLIFTGTPAGVGPVVRGDALVGEIEGIGRVETTIA